MWTVTSVASCGTVKPLLLTLWSKILNPVCSTVPVGYRNGFEPDLHMKQNYTFQTQTQVININFMNQFVKAANLIRNI